MRKDNDVITQAIIREKGTAKGRNTVPRDPIQRNVKGNRPLTIHRTINSPAMPVNRFGFI